MIRERSIVLYIVLTIITCGIFGLYWFVCLTDDTNAAAEVQGTSGGLALLLTLITCGIYGLYWAYKCGEKIDIAHEKRGLPAGNGGILYLLLYIFGGVIAYALIQNELNKLSDNNYKQY
ncbi:MAG: DUF4234 domain-containing protein [Lachnospiraceae bacterium]|nr:DUF4234 domain-containing protein [Lachnospiraceae bacterium]